MTVTARCAVSVNKSGPNFSPEPSPSVHSPGLLSIVLVNVVLVHTKNGKDHDNGALIVIASASAILAYK